MAGHLSPEKAKEILKHGEVRGHPLTKAQKGFFGARAGGLPEKNAPLFPVPSDEGMRGLTPQEREALSGPDGSFVGSPPGGFAGETSQAFDGADEWKAKATHPAQPLNDADFPNSDTFSRGTKDALNTGGL